jgi:hypothetical protein
MPLVLLELAAASVPTPPSGKVTFFLNADDGTPSFKDDAGVVTPVTSSDPELAAIAGLVSAADRGIIFTGSGTAALFTLTAAALTVLDDATVGDMVATLGGASSTGTGGLVRASAPTLTDPVVGTQSAGDNSTKAASTAYADAAVAAGVAGLSWKQAVRVATTAPGTLATDFDDAETVDGMTLATGDRLLVKDQADPTENGIYIVAASGAPTRATDANAGAELVNASCYVSEGTTNEDTQWSCTADAPITLGATNLPWAQITGTGGAPASHAASHQSGGGDEVKLTESLIIAVGDETTAITTGAGKVTFRMPYAFTVTAVKASLTTTSSSGDVVVDINEGGTTILSAEITVDEGDTTSIGGAQPGTISDASLADDAVMTVDIDSAGTGAAGLKVTLVGRRT